MTDAEALRASVRHSGARLTLATYLPHRHPRALALLLARRPWHRSAADVKTLVLPPSQMVAHLRAGRIDGFCAGEPWGAQAITEGVGFTLATSQSIWPDHPEKVLGCTRAFVEEYPNTARGLVMAVLEASRFIDQSQENRRSTAQLIAGRDYIDAPLAAIESRFLGLYQDGLGNAWQDEHPLRFFGEGGEPALSLRRPLVHDPAAPLGPRCAKTRTTCRWPTRCSKSNCIARPPARWASPCLTQPCAAPR